MKNTISLAISTSQKRCSCALAINSKIHFFQNDAHDNQGESLPKTIKSMLQEHSIQWKDVDVLVVDIGPGSFVGTRVGTSYAMGIRSLSAIPTFGVSGLQAMCLPSHQNCISVIKANANEYYFGKINNENWEYGVMNMNDLMEIGAEYCINFLPNEAPESLMHNQASKKIDAQSILEYYLHFKDTNYISDTIDPLYIKPVNIGPKKQNL